MESKRHMRLFCLSALWLLTFLIWHIEPALTTADCSIIISISI